MRILFFSHYFPPEVNAPASRTFEHCHEWVRAGHEVHVITGIPSHPHGCAFPGYAKTWYRFEVVKGIHVHRVWTYLAPNKGVARRTVNYLSFVPASVLRALRLGRFDVAIGTSPQFFCAVATWLYARLRRTPWVFELRDLWPESIPAVGAMKKSFALRLLERLELRMYRDATAIACLTRAFMANLMSRGVPAGKLHFVPNGIVPSFWRNGARAAGRHLLQLPDDAVVVSYVGTIGMAHGLRTTLEAARLLGEEHPQVRFAIVGDGAELNPLKQAARELTNVQFTGLLPREKMPDVLAATDIALVTLKPSDVFKTVLPSKMFEAMAAARAIVLGVDGEAKDTLVRAGAGLAVRPGDAGALAHALEQLAKDPARREQMGKGGAAFVSREFDRGVWAIRYLELLLEISQPSPVAAEQPAREPRAVTSASNR